jgi:3-dehydroquinate synthetase
LVGFKEAKRVASLIVQYQLPAFYKFDANKALQVMQADKKRVKDVINYVLLEKIGKGIIKPLTIREIKPVIDRLSN